MTVTELELKTLLLQKKSEGKHLGRAELPINLEKTESVESRKTFNQDQREFRDGESPQENTMQSFQLEFDCETRESRNSSRTLLQMPNPREPTGQSYGKT